MRSPSSTELKSNGESKEEVDSTTNRKDILVTPELARKYLETNIGHNRRLREKKVLQYARDMKEKRWKSDTAEYVKIGKSGNLVDGQHRMAAVIKSGTPTILSFAFNVPDEVFDVLDTGLQKSAQDIFRISEIKNANILPGIIQQYSALLLGVGDPRGLGSKKLTNAQILNLYELNENYWQEISKKSLSWYNSFARIITPSVLGGLYAFLETKDEEKAFIFMEQLCCPINTDHEAITLLKNSLMKDKMSIRKMTTTNRMGIIIKAWNFYRMNKPCKQLKYNPEIENFPEAK